MLPKALLSPSSPMTGSHQQMVWAPIMVKPFSLLQSFNPSMKPISLHWAWFRNAALLSTLQFGAQCPPPDAPCAAHNMHLAAEKMSNYGRGCKGRQREAGRAGRALTEIFGPSTKKAPTKSTNKIPTSTNKIPKSTNKNQLALAEVFVGSAGWILRQEEEDTPEQCHHYFRHHHPSQASHASRLKILSSTFSTSRCSLAVHQGGFVSNPD